MHIPGSLWLSPSPCNLVQHFDVSDIQRDVKWLWLVAIDQQPEIQTQRPSVLVGRPIGEHVSVQTRHRQKKDALPVNLQLGPPILTPINAIKITIHTLGPGKHLVQQRRLLWAVVKWYSQPKKPGGSLVEFGGMHQKARGRGLEVVNPQLRLIFWTWWASKSKSYVPVLVLSKLDAAQHHLCIWLIWPSNFAALLKISRQANLEMMQDLGLPASDSSPGFLAC